MKYRGVLAMTLLLVCLSVSGCVVLESSSISDRSGSGPRVASEQSRVGILHLTVPEGLTELANTDLVHQCQSGILTNVTTELKVREWLIAQDYSVVASAECVPLPPPPPPPPAAPEKVVLRGVHFAFNKAIIRSEDMSVLDEAADSLKSSPNTRVNVNGYCDAIGSERYNMRLSQRRAEAVVTYLEGKGIASDRLIPQGFGKTNFVASNDTAEGRAQNRRVELIPIGQ